MTQPQVAVIGSGAARVAEAEAVGRLLAEHGCTVVTGGLGEVMAAAHRGAKSGGGTTVAMRGSERRIVSAFATVARNSGDLAVSIGEWMTTIGAELERPPKFLWISSRACTDCDPFACQPAPDNAVSTFGANTARAAATTAHATATTRT